jgi:hypothetical protein
VGHSRFGRLGEKNDLLPLPGIEIKLLASPACSVVTILTELSRLYSTRLDVILALNIYLNLKFIH